MLTFPLQVMVSLYKGRDPSPKSWKNNFWRTDIGDYWGMGCWLIRADTGDWWDSARTI